MYIDKNFLCRFYSMETPITYEIFHRKNGTNKDTKKYAYLNTLFWRKSQNNPYI